MPNMDGTGPFGNGRPGRGQGPCRKRDDAAFRPGSVNGQAAGRQGQRVRNQKPGLSGRRNGFAGRNRGFGRTR